MTKRMPASAHSMFWTCSRICSISELELQRAIARSFEARRLRAERVRLAVQLLREEVEALADRAALGEHALDFVEVRGQARELLVDVDLARRTARSPARMRSSSPAAERLAQPLGELLLVGRDRLRHQRRELRRAACASRATRSRIIAASFAPSRARAATSSSSALRAAPPAPPRAAPRRRRRRRRARPASAARRRRAAARARGTRARHCRERRASRASASGLSATSPRARGDRGEVEPAVDLAARDAPP